MSKISISGNTSGTGNFTITTPATNTDRTLTLPDDTGTVVYENASGNVGIGTSSPASLVTINSTTNAHLQYGYDDSIYGRVGRKSDGNHEFSSYENGAALLFGTSGTNGSTTERMRIESDGDVAMGTTTTGPRLAISDSRTNNYAVKINCSRGSGETGFLVQFTENTSNFSNSVGSIRSNGSSVSYLTTSDYRLKENVVDMTDAIARVKSLAPKRFNFIADEGDTTVDGFLAHEAQTVVPEAVSGTHNEVDDDGNPEYQGIDQSKLVPLLTAALQEAIGRIETLEAEVATLKGASA